MLVPNNGNTISPHDSPRTNSLGGQPQAVSGSIHIPTSGQPPQQQAYVNMQQIAQVTTQTLTPVSIIYNVKRTKLVLQFTYKFILDDTVGCYTASGAFSTSSCLLCTNRAC